MDEPTRPEGLDEAAAGDDPLPVVAEWLAQAEADPRVVDATAAFLATAGADGAPSGRVVLLKGIDGDGGFRFYTAYGSRKGRELDENPVASLVLWWGPLHRQVRISGAVERLDRATSEAYFRSRPLGSRIATWTSRQSQPVASRAELERRVAETAARFADGDVPLPDGWGGLRVVAREIELWHGRDSRLHDRLRYEREGPGAAWVRTRLEP